MVIHGKCGICGKLHPFFYFCGKSSGNGGKLVIFIQKLQFVISSFQKAAKTGNGYKKGSISTKLDIFPQSLHRNEGKIFLCGLFS